jgi:hypothetical protein
MTALDQQPYRPSWQRRRLFWCVVVANAAEVLFYAACFAIGWGGFLWATGQ